ncbi:MAG: hypothetical protein JSU63_21275 [Phycisphaerales bacterium]|nr:MAG: hypothetical protein JSU63_21275 [Phycisphaerales bacterium]
MSQLPAAPLAARRTPHALTTRPAHVFSTDLLYCEDRVFVVSEDMKSIRWDLGNRKEPRAPLGATHPETVDFHPSTLRNLKSLGYRKLVLQRHLVVSCGETRVLGPPGQAQMA